MEKTFKITLSDGTVLDNLGLNGNNFISEKKIKDSVFDGNLNKIEIYNKETEETQILRNAELVQNIEFNGEYWFTFREKSPEELDIDALNGAIMELAEIIAEL